MIRPLFDEPLNTEIAYSPRRSKRYLGSPSIVALSDDSILVSHDFFGPNSPKNKYGESNLTHIYKSRDNGLSWERISKIRNAFWSSLFYLNSSVYLIGCSSEYGDIVIRKSKDRGKTWTIPYNNKTGLLFKSGVNKEPPNYHSAPVPIVFHNDRIYRAFEDNENRKWPQGFKSFIISAKTDSDLLKASSWEISNKSKFSIPDHLNGINTKKAGWLEGNAVLAPNGKIWNILRVHSVPSSNIAAISKLSSDNKEFCFEPSKGFIKFPGGMSKFTIRFSPTVRKYLTISNEVNDEKNPYQRNRLVLASSEDLINWKTRKVLIYEPEITNFFKKFLNFVIPSKKSYFLTSKIGFQYADWVEYENDLLIVVRTAYNNAQNFHDSNYITFYRLRNLTKQLS